MLERELKAEVRPRAQVQVWAQVQFRARAQVQFRARARAVQTEVVVVPHNNLIANGRSMDLLMKKTVHVPMLLPQNSAGFAGGSELQRNDC
jgi:hypothetical protein